MDNEKDALPDSIMAGGPTRVAVFPISTGEVRVQFPHRMTAGDVAQLVEYLDVFLDNQRRFASTGDQT